MRIWKLGKIIAGMDLYRFYVPDLVAQFEDGKSSGDKELVVVRLPDDQAHHARSVLRLEAGQAVEVFDGRGAWCRGGCRQCPWRVRSRRSRCRSRADG